MLSKPIFILPLCFSKLGKRIGKGRYKTSWSQRTLGIYNDARPVMMFKYSTMVEYAVVGGTMRSFVRALGYCGAEGLFHHDILLSSQDLPVRRQWLHSGP